MNPLSETVGALALTGTLTFGAVSETLHELLQTTAHREYQVFARDVVQIGLPRDARQPRERRRSSSRSEPEHTLASTSVTSGTNGNFILVADVLELTKDRVSHRWGQEIAQLQQQVYTTGFLGRV